MNWRFLTAILVLCVAMSVGLMRGEPAVFAGSQAAGSQMAPDELFRLTSPSVVQIIIKDDDGREIGSGSGFVIAASDRATGPTLGGKPSYPCTIATNYHVIWPAVDADARFADGVVGHVYAVIGENEACDVALIESYSERQPPRALALDIAGTSKQAASAPHSIDGNDQPAVGTRILTIGSPKGLQNTLSEGLVSGFRERGNGFRRVQITAPISPGSSGGPVLTMDGRVIGMATAFIEGGGKTSTLPYPLATLPRCSIRNHQGG